MRMPGSAMVLLALGLVAASQSGNLVRIADAHPVVIAGWRLLLAALAMIPIAGPRIGGLRELPSRLLLEAVLAGIALGAHLVAWIAAVQKTTVANAATFFCINPLLTALAARIFLGERVNARLGGSIVLGLAGVLTMGIHDLRLSPDHLEGDLLSILCSALFTIYLLAGRRVRAVVDNRVYVLVLYSVAGLATLSVAVLQGQDWLDPSPRNWLAYGLLALVPTLLGHTFLNHSLRWLSAARLSVLTLTEPAFAGVVAWLAWGEAVSWSTVGGYGLIALSVVVLLWDVLLPRRQDAAEVPGSGDST
ncbi:DMT family transporter [Myxococcota bacterium]|nr:DMT family transporter [Myxococcota bacterium]